MLRAKHHATSRSARTWSRSSTSSTRRWRSRRGTPASAAPAVPTTTGKVATPKLPTVAIVRAAKTKVGSLATRAAAGVAVRTRGTTSIRSTGPRTGVIIFPIRGSFRRRSWRRCRRNRLRRGSSIFWIWRGTSGRGRWAWGTRATVRRSSSIWSRG
uniref:(northern house mosquito) hypothetical protein n=1 Tax=Culex pipiens TaxID=7175 RepID=A0A8D8KJ87_CULPI